MNLHRIIWKERSYSRNARHACDGCLWETLLLMKDKVMSNCNGWSETARIVCTSMDDKIRNSFLWPLLPRYERNLSHQEESLCLQDTSVHFAHAVDKENKDSERDKNMSSICCSFSEGVISSKYHDWNVIGRHVLFFSTIVCEGSRRSGKEQYNKESSNEKITMELVGQWRIYIQSRSKGVGRMNSLIQKMVSKANRQPCN